MIGTVAYCYSTFEGGTDGDLFSSFFNNGVLGWAAFSLLLVGVGVWIAGNVALLGEAERSENSGDKPQTY